MTLPSKPKFHLGWKKLKVRVRPASIQGVALGYAISEEEADAVNEFVQQHSLGQRCSYDMWRMNSASSRTMFQLRWG